MERNLTHVLCVDDEPNVLEGLVRTLRRHFQVTTAVGAEAGLKAFQERTSFPIVVSDLRMPGMDGVAFLSRIRRTSPETVRVLLTGQADLPSAIGAVNEGSIFRFLSKPCPPDTLLRAMLAAEAQHRLITAERVLLEETLHGSIQALVDVFALVNPAGFGRATRARNLVARLADHFRLESRWQLEVAALVSQIGSVTLPTETIEKLYRGECLTREEALAAERLPRIASEVVARIPRMEEVQKILAHLDLRFDGAGAPAGAPRGKSIPFGARVLKLALDIDVLESQGVSLREAVEMLSARSGWYDPDLLNGFLESGGAPRSGVVEIELLDAEPGMVVAEDVRTADGALLLARGQVVSDSLVERVRNLYQIAAARHRVRVVLTATARTADDGDAPAPGESRIVETVWP